MNAPLFDPEVIATASVRDDDSAIHFQRIKEDDGSTSVALWGTEDADPDLALAYTLVPESELLTALTHAGYTVTRTEES